jgi:hypothetical protein
LTPADCRGTFSPESGGRVMLSAQKKIEILSGIRPDFLPTWESQLTRTDADLFGMILKPSPEVSATFGFEREIAFFISTYNAIQPRSLVAIERVCSEEPFKGRVDPSIAMFHAPASDLEDWLSRYQSENADSRMIVPITEKTLTQAIDDPWALRNAIKSNLFVRNLFDYKLPLKSDTFFYGREDIVALILDNVKKSQNTGIFGLRKTGKTSVLLKVQRALRKNEETYTIFLDGKLRSTRKSTCDDIAAKLVREISSFSGKSFDKQLGEGVDTFDVLLDAVQSIPKGKKVCIIIDEIEYLSPISPLDPHWKSDFIDLWQAFWTIQSRTDKICFIVCGVNSTVCDRDRFPSPVKQDRTVQNPMFSIFNTIYLKGFDHDSLKNMINFFGARMGLKFPASAIARIHDQYGGHPLLSRLACGYYHELLNSTKADRPIEIDLKTLRETEEERDTELSSYCAHVVAEIEEFYPVEFEMLTSLASGDIATFDEFSREREYVKHIVNYGLVSANKEEMPRFEIPVVRKYLRNAGHLAKTMISASLPSQEKRRAWLIRRGESILTDLTDLGDERRSQGLFYIYKPGDPKRGYKLTSLGLVDDESSATSFLVTLHKAIIEPADKFLKKGTASNPDFSAQLPLLHRAFMRVKSYRNYYCHEELYDAPMKDVVDFVQEDFDGNFPDSKVDFSNLQRIILDNLHVALQKELSSLR